MIGHYNENRLNAYKIIETIGEGATSKVKLVEEISTHTKYAMKIIKPTPGIQKQIDREIEILNTFAKFGNNECPYLVNLHELIVTKKKIILVLNYVSGGDLEEKINSAPNGYLTEPEAHFYFSELIQAISYLHSKNITHRDLKLENMLIDSDGNLRLADFGLSIMADTDLSTHCGTPYYVAPEVFFNSRYDGPPADVWSCGIVLYIMLSGNFPFEGKNFEELGRKVMKGKITYPDHFSPEVIDLISHILNVDIDQRYTIQQIMKHKWFKDTPDEKPLKPTELDTFDNLLIEIDTGNNNAPSHPAIPASTRATRNRKFHFDESSSSGFESSESRESSDDSDIGSQLRSCKSETSVPPMSPQRLSSSSNTTAATCNNNNDSKEKRNNSSSSSTIDIEDSNNKKEPDFRTLKNRKLTMPVNRIPPISPPKAKTLKLKTKSISSARSTQISKNDRVLMTKRASGSYLFELDEPVSDASQDTLDFLFKKKARLIDKTDSENSENKAQMEAKIKLSLFSKLKLSVEISNEGDDKDKSHVIVTLTKGRKTNFKRFLFMLNASYQSSLANRE